MREILFRGVSKDTIEWVEGWFEMYPYARWPLKETIIPAEEAKDGYFHHVEVIPETVGQFTGLTDKNGKKIFEGDIMSEQGYLFVVVYDTKWARFKLQHIGRAIQYPEWNRGIQMEIVGNIHDNPELLEG